MKKKIILLSTALVLSFAGLVSCGSGKTTEVPSEEASTEAPVNVSSLKSVEVNISKGKLTYSLGQAISYENISILETYSNTLTDDTYSVSRDLSGYTKKVTDAEGKEVTGAFPSTGTYTVTLSKDGFSDSYEVTVGGRNEDVSDVAKAVRVAAGNKEDINGGHFSIQSVRRLSGNYDAAVTDSAGDYEYGQDYVHTTDETNPGTDYYHSLDDTDQIFSVMTTTNTDGSKKVSMNPTATVYRNSQGVELNTLFNYAVNGSDASFYGAEDALTKIYNYAMDGNEHSYQETLDVCPYCGEISSYAFSYAVEFEDPNAAGDASATYKFVVDVNFELDPVYQTLSYLKVLTKYYNNKNAAIIKNDDGAFIGVQQENYPDQYITTEVRQTIGEKDAVNPYSSDAVYIHSYKLNYIKKATVTETPETSSDGRFVGGTDCVNGDTIHMELGEFMELRFVDVLPVSADFTFESISVDGSKSSGLYAYYSSTRKSITAAAKGSGTYVITINTKNTSMKITFVVAQPAPTSMSGAQYIENGLGGGAFTETTLATGYTDDPVYVKPVVNSGADDSFTASFAEDYGDKAALTTATIGEESCYALTAKEAGTYKVIMTSSKDPSVSCSLDVQVAAAPSVADILNGTYTVDMLASGGETKTYTITFTPSEAGAASGQVTVSDGTNSGTLNYTADGKTVKTTYASGSNMGTTFSIDQNFNLCAVRNGNTYIMTRAE